MTGETQGTAIATGKTLAPLVAGRDPFDLVGIVDDFDAAIAGNPSIKAAIEIALWDLCGKLAGQPVCRLLGQYRHSFETNRTVYLGQPATMAEKAREVVREGYKVVKVKVGEFPEGRFGAAAGRARRSATKCGFASTPTRAGPATLRSKP